MNGIWRAFFIMNWDIYGTIHIEQFRPQWKHKSKRRFGSYTQKEWPCIANSCYMAIRISTIRIKANGCRGAAGESVQPFYGDWCQWEGHSDVGYFLGALLIRSLTEKYTLKELANLSLETVEEKVLSMA